MNIAYVANVRLPTERAHGHQIAQVCDALAALGHEVTVYAPFRRNIVSQDYWDYYGADKRVALRYLGSFDPIKAWWLPGILGLHVLNAQFTHHLLRDAELAQSDLIYTRSPALLPTLLRTGAPVTIELHSIPRAFRQQFAAYYNRCRSIVCLTSAMKDQLISYGVQPELVVVEGDGVDLQRFTDLPDQTKARQQLGFSTDRPVAGYIGRLKTLGMDKGVADLLKATAKLKQTDQPVFCLVVGGPDTDTAEYKQMAESLGLTDQDVHFTGAVPATMVPAAMAACDILAMPWPDKPHYRTNMSPLKMFEYMAAKRPILTSDLPTIRDVLDEKTAFFCQPDNPDSIAVTIQTIITDKTKADQIVNNAAALIQDYSWEKRMERALPVLS